jgi:hypothetical protein
MAWLPELLDGLTEAGLEIRPGAEPDQYLITADRGGPRRPPVVLTATESSVRRCVEEYGPSVAAVWPDVEPPVAGYRILLVHIEEYLAGRRPLLALTFSDGELVATQGEAPPEFTDIPPEAVGDLRWVMAPPDEGDPEPRNDAPDE